MGSSDSGRDSLACAIAEAKGSALEGGGVLAEVERRMFPAPLPPRLGRYLLHQVLGEGGFGVVHEAHDTELDRRVAVKLVQPLRSEQRATRRLLREAQAMAQLSHRNVVEVFDVGVFGESDHGRSWPADLPTRGVYIVMELVPGGSLQQWLAAERRTAAEVIAMFAGAGEGLAAAHAQGILHRDFKPANVLIDAEGRPKVVDFGLARAIRGGSSMFSASETGPLQPKLALVQLGESLTRDGTAVGTPRYMAPEQHMGRGADERSDQYNFCVALYEGLYGREPFAAPNLGELSKAKARGDVPPAPAESGVPEAARRVVLRGLRPDPRERWSSMRELLDELRRPPRRRAPLVAAVGAAALLAGGAAWWAASGEGCHDGDDAVEEIWNVNTRGEIERTFDATGSKYAERAAGAVAVRLDSYARAWASAHQDACEASPSQHDLDGRMQCLRAGLGALDAAVGVLGQADRNVVARAVDVVAQLRHPRHCQEAGDEPIAAPPVEVAQVRAQLQQGAALILAGKDQRAEGIAEEAAVRAKALGHAPLVADALVMLGRAKSNLGDYGGAARDLQQAYFAARRSGNDAAAAEAAAVLMQVLTDGTADFAGATQWARHGTALAERLGAHPVLEAQLANRLGYLAEHEGRYPEALRHYRRQLELLEGEVEAGDFQLAGAYRDTGRALFDLGQLSEGVAHLERALAVAEDVLGPDHPGVASFCDALGSVLLEQGEYERARTLLQRSVDVGTEPADQADLAGRMTNLANVLLRLGEVDEALATYERALDMASRQRGADHPLAALILTNLGQIRLMTGDNVRAEEEFTRALDQSVAALGPEHPQVAQCYTGLGRALQAQGRHAEALEQHEKALQILTARMGADHVDVSRALHDIGLTHLQRGDPAAAVEYLRRAFDLRDRSDIDRLYAMESRAALAEALMLTDDGADRGREHARAALVELEGMGAAGEAIRAELHELLGL